jgi:NO-binding membrane sensor protein with MHYT domain/GAF domain-containing protein
MQHTVIMHNHNPALVVLSVVIATLASYVALDLAGRVTAARGQARLWWLVGGAVAMGLGIWSMHFTAMLAFQLPIPIKYDVPTVLLSLLAAIGAAGLALFIVSRDTMRWPSLLGGGVFMGGAIAAMHYIGMEAMRLQASLQYETFFFSLSILIAISASLAALWLAFRFRQATTGTAKWLKLGSAVVMGIAIAGMHYTAMQAAIFIPSDSFRADPSQAIDISTLGVGAIALGTFMVLGLALLLSLIDKRMAAQAMFLVESELRYKSNLEVVNSELQKRVTGLQLVTEVSQTMTAILDQQRLISKVIEQIQSAFTYYHIHIYLFDEKYEDLVMVGGTGEAGQIMLARGYKVSGDKGIVGRAAVKNITVLVSDVTQQPDWLSNPLLPETTAEVAIPIALGQHVLGVLDVQHNIINGLKQADIELLQTIANQMAVALRNARLFTEIEAALADARIAQERYLKQSWEKAKVIQYGGQHLATRPGAPLLAETTLAEAKRYALAQKRPAIVSINGPQNGKASKGEIPGGNEPQSLQSMIAPVIIGRTTIGAFQAHRAGTATKTELADLSWTEQDLDLVEAVLDQVAQIADNLRLFAETNERGSREQIIREITDKLQAAPTLDLLLEITAHELGERLSAGHTVVELGINKADELAVASSNGSIKNGAAVGS